MRLQHKGLVLMGKVPNIELPVPTAGFTSSDGIFHPSESKSYQHTLNKWFTVASGNDVVGREIVNGINPENIPGLVMALVRLRRAMIKEAKNKPPQTSPDTGNLATKLSVVPAMGIADTNDVPAPQ